MRFPCASQTCHGVQRTMHSSQTFDECLKVIKYTDALQLSVYMCFCDPLQGVCSWQRARVGSKQEFHLVFVHRNACQVAFSTEKSILGFLAQEHLVVGCTHVSAFTFSSVKSALSRGIVMTRGWVAPGLSSEIFVPSLIANQKLSCSASGYKLLCTSRPKC